MLDGCWKIIMARVARARARGQESCTVLYCTLDKILVHSWKRTPLIGDCDISIVDHYFLRIYTKSSRSNIYCHSVGVEVNPKPRP